MLQHYISFFKTGNVDYHKESQRCWIKDKGPAVESNIGWIETYVDPCGERAAYQGWISVVDQARSKKFQQLATLSE
jgi:dipeptidyl-peptidase III